MTGGAQMAWEREREAYLERELQAQREQTARIELLHAQVAECLSDAEAAEQLQQPVPRPRAQSKDQGHEDSWRDATDIPPPYDAPSFPASSVSGSNGRGSMEAWGPEQPRVWRRRSSEYSSISNDLTGTDIGLQARRRAPRQLNPVLNDLVAEYSREWDIPLEDAEGGMFPEFVDLEVLSDSVLAAKSQERKRLRRQRRRAAFEKAHAAARILSKLRVRQTWVKWLVLHRANAETALRRMRHQALEQKLRFRLTHRAAAQAFGAWKALLKEVLALRTVLVRVMARMKHIHLASAWTAWVACCERVRSLKRVLNSTIVRLQHSKLGASFAGWRENSNWQRRTRRMGTRVASRLYNMRVSAAFARWQLMLEQKKRTKSMMRSVALRLRQLSMATAWAQWYALVAQSLKIRMAGRVILKRLKNATVAAAFRQWVAWSRQRQREVRLIRKVAGKLRQRTVSAVFVMWSASARDAILNREAAARVQKAAERMVRQWIMRSLSQAMRSWQATTAEILRQRYELKKIALRWHNRQLSNAWLMLCAGCDAARAAREDEVGRAREESRQLAAQEKAIALLCGRRGSEFCRQIMIRWTDWAAVSSRLCRLLSRGEGHHRERLLLATLAAWCVTTAERRSLRRLAERLTGRLSEHAMKSALLQWHRGASMAATKRRAEGKLRKFGLSQAALRSKAVFKGWADLVACNRMQRQRLSIGLRRAAAGVQGRAWYTWLATVRRIVNNRMAVAGAVQKIRLKAAMLCFQMWAAFVLAQQEKEAKLRRGALRFSRNMVVKAFGAWKEHIKIGAQLHKLLGKGTERQTERQKAKCYTAWVHAVHAAQHYRVVSSKIARKSSRGICLETLYGWRQVVAETARLNATLRRCSLRLAHARTGSAFNWWLTVVTVDESKHYAAARFAMGAASTRSRFVFREWAAVSARIIEEKRRREDKLSSSLKRMLMRLKMLAFECWLELFDALQQRKESLAKALRRLKSLESAKAFQHWRGALFAKRKRQARAAHAMLVADTRLRLKRGGRVFRPWIGWIRARKAQRAMIRKGLRKCARVALKHYTAAWRVYTVQCRHAAGAVRKMLNWHLALSFGTWLQLMERKRERLRMLLSTMTQWADGFAIRRVFLRWASCVQRATGASEPSARAFRPALAGLSPNLAARYRDIVAEDEFVQHPAVSPGLRDHSPRPTSPLRHVDVRSSGSDYSLRGSGEGSSLVLGASAVGSPSQSSLSLQGVTNLPDAVTSGRMASPIADWSLEQLASAAPPPPSQVGYPNDIEVHNSGSLSGPLDFRQDRRIASMAQKSRHNSLNSAESLAQSIVHQEARGPPLQSHAQMHVLQAQQPFGHTAKASRMAVNSSLATTASGASYDGLPPTSARPDHAEVPRLSSAEMWLQQRRSQRRSIDYGAVQQPVTPSFAGDRYR
eukprot:COSAG02_NODE_111_length_36009_cov_42.221248_8_plen_1415_part_00